MVALGFELKTAKCITNINLDSITTGREKSAVFDFGDYNPRGENIKKYIADFVLPKAETAMVSVGKICKLASHNYQVLKSLIVEHRPLRQIRRGSFTLLKNDVGETVPDLGAMGSGLMWSSDLVHIAIACSFGCSIVGYRVIGSQYEFDVAPNNTGLNIVNIAESAKTPAMTQEDNVSPLAVVICMFINRKLLVADYYQQQLLITKGRKQAYIDKDSSQRVRELALQHLNL